ncbi:MAG: hypothetical protein IH828_04245 [Nitrospinae bacterium]|nr:hypothetical protein [Nitrospinota bacterium]
MTEQEAYFKHLVARLSRIFGFSKTAVMTKPTDLRHIRKTTVGRAVESPTDL